jgi:type II secretory pathway pseudopilin PulG
MKMRNAFTIIESTLAVCLIGLLTAIAAPAVSRLLDVIEVREAAIEVETMFSSARHLAIARGMQASVEIDTARRVVSVISGADTLRKRELGKEHRVEIKATRPSVSYSTIGAGYGAANVTVVIKRNASFDSVVVSRLGRVRR